MKKQASKKEYTFPLKYLTSKREYHCDGCDGEFKIPEDSLYAMSASIGKDGKITTMRFCIRCVCAILNKQKFTKNGFTVGRGDLRLAKLSSKFRKIWTQYFNTVIKLNGSPEGDGLTHQLLTDLGLDTLERRKNNMEEDKKKQRMIHREKRELKAFMKQTGDIRKLLVSMMQKLATLHLKETVAWTKGDEEEIEQAKTEYGQFAISIVRIIENWQMPEAEKTEKKSRRKISDAK